MIKSWDKFYSNWTKKDYEKHITAWKGFCHKIAEFTPKHGKILEVGFGTGMMSIYLATLGFKVTGIDNCKIQIERARRLAKEIGVEVNFLHQDILSHSIKSTFDTSFSQGLLEHFSDEYIKKIIKIQFELAKVVLFSVPLDKFGHKSRGDERLLSENYWKKLIKEYNILHWSTFANDRELMCAITQG